MRVKELVMLSKRRQNLLSLMPDNHYEDQEELEKGIELLGRVSRSRKDLIALADNKIAAIREALKEELVPYDQKIAHIASGVKFYVGEHRDELFPNFPTRKTAKLVSGSLKIRRVPPSIKTRATSEFLESIVKKGGLFTKFTELVSSLSRNFLRVKLELNKDAILADPIGSKNAIGIELSEESERLYIIPAEVDAEHDVSAGEQSSAA